MPGENLEDKLEDSSGDSGSLAHYTGIELGSMLPAATVGTLAYYHLTGVASSMIGYVASTAAIAAGVTSIAVLATYSILKAILGGSKPKKEEPEAEATQGPPGQPRRPGPPR